MARFEIPEELRAQMLGETVPLSMAAWPLSAEMIDRAVQAERDQVVQDFRESMGLRAPERDLALAQWWELPGPSLDEITEALMSMSSPDVEAEPDTGPVDHIAAVTDLIDSALDGYGGQHSPETDMYSDVAPPIEADGKCWRCTTNDTADGSDLCVGCRAFLLEDTDVDPTASEWPSALVPMFRVFLSNDLDTTSYAAERNRRRMEIGRAHV